MLADSADHADRARSLPIEASREPWLRLVRNRKNRERYGPAHRRRRRELFRRLERGEVFACFRCGGELDYDSDWELDHDDHDPTRSFPSYRSCNRGAPHRNVTSRDW